MNSRTVLPWLYAILCVNLVSAALPPPPLNGVATGSGQYLAVGDKGAIWRSPDALYWTNQPSVTTNALWGATFGAGQFVAVGDAGTIVTSPDGAAWTQRASSTPRRLRAAAYGLGQFVAVGDQNVLLHSTNGVTWTNRLVAGSNQWADVAFGGGVFAAVGSRSVTNMGGVVAFSTNGLNWTIAATTPSGYPLTGVTYGNGMFVALGQNNIVLRSTNGINWQQSFGDIFYSGLRLTHGDGRFVAVTPTVSQSFTSTNGFAWFQSYFPVSAWMRGVAFADGRFVTVGHDARGNGAILVSPDGANWNDALAPYYAPVISYQPQSVVVPVGSSATLSVSAVGNPSPEFQWRFHGVSVPGATREYLEIPEVTASNIGNYTVVVSNPFGVVTSLVATVSLYLKAPEFFSQPEDTEVALGGNVSLYAYADGSPSATYQWYFSGVPLPGQMNDSLNFSNASALYAGDYFVVASNGIGASTSRVARVTVVPLLVENPLSQYAASGSVIQLYGAAEGLGPLHYQWYFNGTKLPSAASSPLTLGPMTTNHAGSYFLVVTNSLASITSRVAIVGVDFMAPLIVVPPVPVSAPVDGFASFDVYATGSPILFHQWRKNGANIPGAVNAVINFAPRPSDSGNYDVVVRNNFGSVTSAAVTLTVTTSPPRFTYVPEPITARAGETVYFSANADGAPLPRYEWRRNGAILPGQNDGSLTLFDVSFADAGDYTVLASNSEGAVTSRVARLVVYGVPPFFTTQPYDREVIAGDYVTLEVSVDGAPEPQMRWYFNGAPLPGANQSYLSLPNITTNQAGIYTAVASNVLGVAVSREISVVVGLKAPVFVENPSSRTVLWGESVYFFSQASGGPPPAYQWFLNDVPIAGATSPNLTLNFATPAQAGNYRVVATNSVGAVSSAVAVLTVNAQAPVFISQPASRTALWGDVVSFAGSVSGGPPPGYQWLFNNVTLAGATNNYLALGAVSPSKAGNYRLIAFNAVGAVTSAVAVLTVNSQAPIFSVHPLSRSVLWDSSVTFNSSAYGGPAPTYQWLFNDAPIPGATSPSLSLSSVSPGQAGNYRVVASNPVGVVTSVVAVLTVTSQMPMVSIAPPQITVPWGSAAGAFYAYASGGPVPTLQWLFNGQPIPGETFSSLNLGIVTPTNAGNYSVLASNAVGGVTSSVAVLTVNSQAPVFVSEPSDETILSGGSVNFYSYATAGPPPDYQWFFNEQPVLNQTNSNLNIPYAGTNSAGFYYVAATNLFGSATSRVATLTIETAPPVFTGEPNDNDALWGSDITFYSYAVGGPTPDYQWRYNGLPIPGATNYYLTLFNVTTNDVGEYDVIASNFLGSITSRAALLNVTALAPQFSFSNVLPGGTVVEGTDVRFYGGAFGGPPPAFFLLLDASPLALPFSQGGGFLLTEVTTNDAGRYSLVASNFVGSVTNVVTDLIVTPGGPLDRWTRRNPLPQGENLLAVTHGNGRFVATGERGSVASSLNGSNWTAQRIRADAELTGVAYGNGVWVSVSRAGNILTSTNAAQWLPRVFDPLLSMEGITFAAGRFVAVGGSGENTSLVSFNGIDWVRGNAAYSIRFRGVAYGNGRFVGVLNSSPTILISTNGLDWTATGTSIAANMENISYADGLFVAVGNNGTILTSPDGDVWTSRASGTTRRLIDVARGNGRWVAVGVRGIIQSSADGLSWQAETSGTPDRLEGATFASGMFVALGENGTTLTSTNGTTWTKRNVGSTRDLDGIAIGANGQIVTVGKFGAILTTPDGVRITERVSGTTNDLHGVAFANGLYVAVGDRGSIITSSNGTVWNPQSLGDNHYFKSVTYSNGLWVAVGTRGSIVTSTNGLNWVALNSGVIKDLNEVVYGNGFFLVVGDGLGTPNGTVLTSTDGATWFDRSIFAGKNFRGATFANGTFLVVGNDGILYTTPDAVSWTPRSSGIFGDGRNLRGATYADGHWVVVGNDGIIITSTNVVDWTRRAPRTVENLHGIRYVNGTFVTIGNRGTILQSGRTIGPVLSVRDFDPVFGFVFAIDAEMGRDYRLQASDDLVNWEDVLEFNNTQETTLFLDSEAMLFPLRFYRVVSP